MSILGNKTYKLANKKEVLKALINKDLLKLYKDYIWMKSVVIIN